MENENKAHKIHARWSKRQKWNLNIEAFVPRRKSNYDKIRKSF